MELLKFLEQSMGDRLNQIVDSIPDCLTLYDIGCDHGFVGLKALLSEKCKILYLIDESENVISGLRKKINLNKISIENLNLEKRRGEEIRVTDLYSSFVIAGMGYNSIMRIVSSLMSNHSKNYFNFVISNNSNLKESQLLEFMMSMGCTLVSSTEVKENSKIYVIHLFSHGNGLVL